MRPGTATSSGSGDGPVPAPAHGLYLHVPFCARRCDYCDFFVVIERAGEGYFEALRSDLALAAGEMAPDGSCVDTIYIGGGTPSLLPPERIGWLLDVCAGLFHVEPGAEITLEANPETVTASRAAAWVTAGVNRLSLGVQSFDDAVLAPRGRSYTGDEAEAAAHRARDAGLAHLGMDLIAGLPGEHREGFLEGVERVARLAPEHVSIYLLETGESGKHTSLSRAVEAGRVRLHDDEDLAGMYEGAVSILEGAGLSRYEIANFSREGGQSRHNLKYWRSDPWAGAGPSAHSYLGGRRRARPADMMRWRRWVEGGGPPEEIEDYTLPSPGQRAREALVLALRLSEGVDLSAFTARWGYDPAERLAGPIAELSEAGLLTAREGRLALTERGVLLSNEVFTRLM